MRKQVNERAQDTCSSSILTGVHADSVEKDGADDSLPLPSQGVASVSAHITQQINSEDDQGTQKESSESSVGLISKMVVRPVDNETGPGGECPQMCYTKYN